MAWRPTADQPHFTSPPCRHVSLSPRRPRRDPASAAPQIVTSAQAPEGQGWLHEVKQDRHRLLAIFSGDARPKVAPGRRG
jgi:hypothetical protein